MSRVYKGTVVTFDAGTYLATVRPAGNLAGGVAIAGVPVARDIAAAEMAAGRTVVVVEWSDGNPADSCVAAVYVG
jgi:hypothetical protein